LYNKIEENIDYGIYIKKFDFGNIREIEIDRLQVYFPYLNGGVKYLFLYNLSKISVQQKNKYILFLFKFSFQNIQEW
jgi:hypothetical protein